VGVHAGIFCHFLVGLLAVPQRFFEPAVEDCELVGAAFLVLFDGASVLGLQFFQFGAETGRKLLHFLGVVLLFVAEALFEDGDVLLEGVDLQLQDAFLVARVVSVAFQPFSGFFERGFELLVEFHEGGNAGVCLVLLLLRLPLR
jgi:hypothetical protein